MPTRKQRRREAKLRRHEWEEVYVDEDGNEIPVEEVEREQPKAMRAPRPSSNGKARVDARGRPIKPVQPPSWQRVFKRVAIFGPLMFIVLTLVNSKQSLASQIAVAAFYTALLIPFMYLMDRLTYRAYLRRTGGGAKRR